MYNPTLINKRERRELLTGYLLTVGQSADTETAFAYHAYSPRAYNVMASALPGFEYIQPTEAIRVTRLDLAFAEGSKVRLADGRLMTVKSITRQVDNNRAHMTGNADVALIITLEGGGT